MTSKPNSSTQTYNEAKLKELVLYVSQKWFGNHRNGSVELNKALFFSDALSYALLGRSITGVEYVRHPYGPAPKGITSVQRSLSMSGDAKILKFSGPGRPGPTIIFPQRDADTSLFTSQEKRVIDLVVSELEDMVTDDVSEMSHTLDGWRLAAQGETIPLFTIFLDNALLSEQDIEAGQAVAEQLRGDLVGLTATPA